MRSTAYYLDATMRSASARAGGPGRRDPGRAGRRRQEGPGADQRVARRRPRRSRSMAGIVSSGHPIQPLSLRPWRRAMPATARRPAGQPDRPVNGLLRALYDVMSDPEAGAHRQRRRTDPLHSRAGGAFGAPETVLAAAGDGPAGPAGAPPVDPGDPAIGNRGIVARCPWPAGTSSTTSDRASDAAATARRPRPP